MNAISWSLYLLAKNPELQTRLRQEVDERLKDGYLQSIRDVSY